MVLSNIPVELKIFGRLTYFVSTRKSFPLVIEVSIKPHWKPWRFWNKCYGLLDRPLQSSDAYKAIEYLKNSFSKQNITLITKHLH